MPRIRLVTLVCSIHAQSRIERVWRVQDGTLERFLVRDGDQPKAEARTRNGSTAFAAYWLSNGVHPAQKDPRNCEIILDAGVMTVESKFRSASSGERREVGAFARGR